MAGTVQRPHEIVTKREQSQLDTNSCGVYNDHENSMKYYQHRGQQPRITPFQNRRTYALIHLLFGAFVIEMFHRGNSIQDGQATVAAELYPPALDYPCRAPAAKLNPYP